MFHATKYNCLKNRSQIVGLVLGLGARLVRRMNN